METNFLKEFIVGWGDLDANNHMRNTAYLDVAGTARFSFFAQQGFPISRFRELHFGPIVFKDEVEYFRELMLLESFSVSFLQDGMNPDGSIFRIVNEFVNSRGQRAALVKTHGAWFNLDQRKIQPPPPDLLAVMRSLPKTSAYAEIPSRNA
jgi:acyl-CoA thioester hydrolase